MPPRLAISPTKYFRLARLGLLALVLGGFLSLLVPLALAADPGDLDPTFNGDGIVTTTIGTLATAYDLILQPDGKIVAAGYSNSGNRIGLALARYTAAGDLDPTFGLAGVVTTPIAASAQANAITLQPDGKIVAGGISATFSATRFALARYTPAGGLDPTFGQGGLVTTTIGPIAIGYSLVRQSDGKIILAGQSTSGESTGFALARYTLAGGLDPTFGQGGIVTSSIAAHAAGRSVTIQPDGKILLAGYSGPAPGPWAFTLARYTPAGDLDPDFGSAGVVTTPIGTLAVSYGVVYQPDGKFVVGGDSEFPDRTRFVLVRYTAAGQLDPTFGAGGVVTTTINPNGFARSLARQPDGKIILAGFSGPGGDFDLALARYTTAGQLDPTFGTGGVVTSHISLLDFGNSLALQPDGKIILAGDTGPGNGPYHFALTRYTGDFLTYLPAILKSRT